MAGAVSTVNGGIQEQTGEPSTVVRLSGGLSNQNGVLTDGGESRAFHAISASIVPMESIAEFRLDMATYSAEFGRSGGGVFNIVTKSGTNQFHGVGYEFLQNNNLNANSWQNNRNDIPNSLYQQNIFGAAIGGPVVKNKFFFFFNYEGLRQGSPIQSLNTVPTALQAKGDFSQTLATTGAPDIVYDPNTTAPNPSSPGAYIRSPFPGNQVPNTRINAVSQAVLPYWPAPNRPGEGPTHFNNYFVSGKYVTKTDTYVARTDYYISDKHRLFGRFNAEQNDDYAGGLPKQDVALVSESVISSPIRNAMIGLTSMFSPSVIGEFRLGYLRIQMNDHWDD